MKHLKGAVENIHNIYEHFAPKKAFTLINDAIQTTHYTLHEKAILEQVNIECYNLHMYEL